MARSQERFSPAAKSTYASAQRCGHRSSSRSNCALPIQSERARSWLSLTPIRRCSGVSTRKRPPRLQNACPPRDCSPSWSTRITRRPASATSAAAVSPARPWPTTMTSASMAGDYGRGVRKQTSVAGALLHLRPLGLGRPALLVERLAGVLDVLEEPVDLL